MEPWITDDLLEPKYAEWNDKMNINYQAQLDMIPIEEIEKYLRRKKLEALKDESKTRR